MPAVVAITTATAPPPSSVNPGEADAPIVVALAVLAALANVVAFAALAWTYARRPRRQKAAVPTTEPGKSNVGTTDGLPPAGAQTPPSSPPGSVTGEDLLDECGAAESFGLKLSRDDVSAFSPVEAEAVERAELVSVLGGGAPASKEWPPSSRPGSSGVRLAWQESDAGASRSC